MTLTHGYGGYMAVISKRHVDGFNDEKDANRKSSGIDILVSDRGYLEH